jgi:hypothetical protein
MELKTGDIVKAKSFDNFYFSKDFEAVIIMDETKIMHKKTPRVKIEITKGYLETLKRDRALITNRRRKNVGYRTRNISVNHFYKYYPEESRIVKRKIGYDDI